MAFATIAAALRTRMETQWAVSHSDVPLYWVNEPARPDSDPVAAWVHVEIRGGAERIAAFGGEGSNRYRQSGEVVIRIFVPSNDGEPVARALADDAAAIFRGYADPANQIRFYAASPVGGAAADQDGNYFEFDVLAPFQFDHVA